MKAKGVWICGFEGLQFMDRYINRAGEFIGFILVPKPIFGTINKSEFNIMRIASTGLDRSI